MIKSFKLEFQGSLAGLPVKPPHQLSSRSISSPSSESNKGLGTTKVLGKAA